MKKFALSVLLVALVLSIAGSAFAFDQAKVRRLGEDKNKMTWWIVDYGKTDGGAPFAISRKYYTNETIKQETIDLLMSKYGISPEVAGSIYFTEYGYEYSADGKQFAVTYLRHYDMLGNEIHGTVYDGSSDAAQKAFAGVPAGSTPAKCAPYALGKPVPQPKAAAKKSVKTSSKRIVRKK